MSRIKRNRNRDEKRSDRSGRKIERVKSNQ
jgi:hypothetical protein